MIMTKIPTTRRRRRKRLRDRDEQGIQFYYDLDTDSDYFALEGSSVDDLVTPHLREHYF